MLDWRMHVLCVWARNEWLGSRVLIRAHTLLCLLWLWHKFLCASVCARQHLCVCVKYWNLCHKALSSDVKAFLFFGSVSSQSSSICKAAIHAGVISADGGVVDVLPLDKRKNYVGVLKNGIQSERYPSVLRHTRSQIQMDYVPSQPAVGYQ